MNIILSRRRFPKIVLIFIACLFLACNITPAETPKGSWRAISKQITLRNDVIEAKFQAGMLYRLRDIKTGEMLISLKPSDLSGKVPIFITSGINLDDCTVSQKSRQDSLDVTFKQAKEITWELHWSIEPGNGDLILRSNANLSETVEEFRIFVPGCNIKDYTLVWIHGYGTGDTANAPWSGTFMGDPEKDPSPMAHPHPIVALFQGRNSGWFIEGREERVGPANILVKGTGNAANLGLSRRFPLTSKTPEMYEIRFRAYHGVWETAVDPYVEWLENGAGFIALDKLPKEQAWINNLKSQAYISVGNYEGLNELAKRVNPKETFVGRQGEFRFHAFDIGYPDYRIPEAGKKWLKHARQLGFHVGMHFNINCVSIMFPELVKRFEPGMQITGKDADGKNTYTYIYEGANRLYRVSAALKDWRDYLVLQIKEAVEVGIDVVYLDEAMSPTGRFVVDGMTGYQGTFELMQQIRKEYPHVAIETEQFNTLTAKYGKIALSQMPLGHPLGGYIFRKFIKVVPEGLNYSPTDAAMMDAFDCWGFMLPGADTEREESWMLIAEAFHKYQLVADPGLERIQFTKVKKHFTGGLLPVIETPVPPQGQKLFGFRGSNGVIAYLEKHPTKRGLVIYEPGKEPKWVGTRHSGIRSYTGPGLPAYFGFREQISDWLIYDENTLLGLDPEQSYWFDVKLKPDPNRFHLFKVPEDFAGVMSMEARTMPQEAGKDDIYFCLRLAGKGQIGAYIPDGYEAYLDGVKLEPEPKSRKAFAEINASSLDPYSPGYYIALRQEQDQQNSEKQTRPAYLIAFKKTDVELEGSWPNLPWYGSNDAAKWVAGNGANGFSMNVGSTARFVGKIPDAAKVRIKGSYKNEQNIGPPGDGVIRINGTEVLRIPHGEKPFKEISFDVDISKYAGRYVCVEVVSDGSVRGASANWNNPMFLVEK